MNNNAKCLGTFVALAIFALLSVACGSGPTTTLSPSPVPTPTPGPVLPTAQDLKQAGEELFSALFTAVETQDFATFHGLLTADIREQCTPEQLQQSLAFDDRLFPKLEVRSVFMDLEDPNRALAQVSLREDPEAGLEGFAPSIATIFPFPMVQEDGQWRLDLSFLLTGAGCPFAQGSSQEETAITAPRRLDATPQPALPRLAPPPGLRPLVSNSGGSIGEYNASLLLETDMTLDALLEHYRQQVLQTEWKVQQETMVEDLAALTWTFPDEEDFHWFGVLLITSAEEGLWWVRLWEGSAAGGPMRVVVPEALEPPVPAPTRPN